MPRDPSYVRLSERLSRGCLADLDDSLWSISGMDVLPFPDEEEEPGAAQFVRRELRTGKLEAASRAEYDEAHPPQVQVETTYKHEIEMPHQEGHLQLAVRAQRRKLEAARADNPSDGEGQGSEAYGHMTVKELKGEVEDRGLEVPSGARKGDLIELLEEHDATAEA